MFLSRLKLVNYKNYAQQEITFSEGMNALLGLNGMGKTNVLDAVYYMCLAKSYFSFGDRYTLKKGEEFFRVEADFSKQDKIDKIVVKVVPGKSKVLESNGKRYNTLSEHVGNFLCVVIAPNDIQLLLEGSEERRNYVNNTIIQYDKNHINDLIVYNRLLKQRNALLKTFAEKRYFDQMLLDVISEKMIGPAERIHEARKLAIEKLSPIFSERYNLISGEREQCKIVYKSQLNSDRLDKLFKESIEKDRVLARTTTGIHKDDVGFYMNDEPLRRFASQGQLKSFVLSLKLAQYKLLHEETQTKPILLLDDLFDKLDEERVKHLLTLLDRDEFGQIMITDTHPEMISKIMTEIKMPSTTFIVDNGSIINK